MCFNLAWIFAFLVWLVVVCAVIMLVRLIIGHVLPKLGLAEGAVAIAVQGLRIVIWAIILIAVIIFVGDLVMCLAPSLSFPRMHGALIIPWIRV